MHIKTIAIIPARGGSKRIPRKNIRPFMGKPVIGYPITTAIQAGCFDEVMVSTDDVEIANVAQSFGAVVPFMRSSVTANDHATTAEVLFEVLKEYEKLGKCFDYFCCIYPVTPLLSTTQLNDAMKALIESDADSLIPVIRYSHPIQRALQIDEKGRLKMIRSENALVRTQDLPPRFHDAGQFYCLKTNCFSITKSLITDNTYALEISERYVQDIDTEEDWKMAELKYRLVKT